MYLCDACGAQLVLAGKVRPLIEIWGANQVPWFKTECANCGSHENCSSQPDARPDMFNKNK